MNANAKRIIHFGLCRPFLDLFAQVLNRDPQLQVVWSSDHLANAMTIARQLKPHIVVLNAQFESGQAFRLASEIRRSPELSHAKLVFIDYTPNDARLKQALELQAEGYLTGRLHIRDYAEILKSIADGEVCFTPEVQDRLTFDGEKKRYQLRFDPPVSRLSNRQIEILRHLANGDSVKMVAHKLHLSPKSVDSHKYRIMRTLGVNNNVCLARLAIREGIIDP